MLELVGKRVRRSLSLMTFNVLAPCYFRHGGRVESEDRTAFLYRAQALIHAIQRENCDLICLQEYWFNHEYQHVFRQRFRGTHYLHALKRPGDKEDGLAMFVHKHKFEIHHIQHIASPNSGDRVTMMMHIATKWNRYELPLAQRSFLLVNSHLTFPHSESYKVMRWDQINLVLDSIRQYVKQEKLHNVPVLMCGDFNDFNDPVHQLVLQEGFNSVFSYVNGREARITHCNHNNREVAVDFIFATQLQHQMGLYDAGQRQRKMDKLALMPSSCHLTPRSLNDSTRLKRPRFGHNWQSVIIPQESHEEQELVNYWRMVSDHRPLVASFDVIVPSSSRISDVGEL